MGYCSCSLRSTTPKYKLITRHLIKNDTHVAAIALRLQAFETFKWRRTTYHFRIFVTDKSMWSFSQKMGLTWLCVSISRMSCDNSNNVAMSRIFEMLRRGSGAALHNLSCHTKTVWLTTLFFCWCCHHIFFQFLLKISKIFGLFEGGEGRAYTKSFGVKKCLRKIIQQGPITLLLQTSVM